MSRIDIRHRHSHSPERARAAVERVADKLRERYQVECAWSQNRLAFKRSGISGHIHLHDGEVQIQAQLGLLLSALRGPIESEIQRYLERELGS